MIQNAGFLYRWPSGLFRSIWIRNCAPRGRPYFTRVNTRKTASWGRNSLQMLGLSLPTPTFVLKFIPRPVCGAAIFMDNTRALSSRHSVLMLHACSSVKKIWLSSVWEVSKDCSFSGENDVQKRMIGLPVPDRLGLIYDATRPFIFGRVWSRTLEVEPISLKLNCQIVQIVQIEAGAIFVTFPVSSDLSMKDCCSFMEFGRRHNFLLAAKDVLERDCIDAWTKASRHSFFWCCLQI